MTDLARPDRAPHGAWGSDLTGATPLNVLSHLSRLPQRDPMTMTAPAPEDMTAEDRRQAWYDRQLATWDADWAYGEELKDLIAEPFRLVEAILGKSVAEPHLLSILRAADGQGETWEEMLENCQPELNLNWRGACLIDEAGIYGVYGVTPEDVPWTRREAWVDELARALRAFREAVKPVPQGSIARIVNLAISRRAIETGSGEVDLLSLACLGGVTEGRIRNILSSGDGGLEKVGQSVTAASAGAWLKGRKAFFASIWQLPEEDAPEPPSPDFADEVVFVPVAADGSCFHPGLARGGNFMIGAKGEEVQHGSFEAALSALQKMAKPRWRRPNEAGNWGIVSGRDWKRVERRQLMSMGSGA